MQISYSQKQTSAREGQSARGDLETPNHPFGARWHTLPNNLSTKTGFLQTWAEASDYQNNVQQHKTPQMAVTPRRTEMKARLEHTENEIFKSYPDNVTCWLHLLPSTWKHFVAFVSLSWSSCVPGNVVTIRGDKYGDLRDRGHNEGQDSMTWTGCEGLQDPLGEFLGREIYVGFRVSRLDVDYSVMVEFNAYITNELAHGFHYQLLSRDVSNVLGEYRAQISTFLRM